VTTNYPNKSLVRKYSVSVSVGSPAGEERGPGPVAYWKFDEGFGQTANDSTINANNGTLGGGTEAYKPTWQTEDMCVSGKCLKFDGVDDYVDAGDIDIIDGATQLSVTAWIKMDDLTADGIIVAKDEFAGYSQLIFYRDEEVYGHPEITDTFHVIVSDGVTEGEIWSVSGSANDSNWHHVAFTYVADSATGMKLYVDGVEDSNSPTTTSGLTALKSTANSLQIGKPITTANKEFNGFIDSVKIYPYARTAAQIKADYASRGTGSGVSVAIGDEGKKSLSDGLVGYWKMDEASWNGTADEVVDSSGSGNDGVRAGDATTAAGKFGNGGTFDGTGDYVDANDYNFTSSDFTLSLWFKLNAYQTGVYECIAGQYNEFALMVRNDRFAWYVRTTTDTTVLYYF
jgi:hypothetical protein